MPQRSYYVYILASVRGVLYVGVTSNSEARVEQHIQGKGGDFSRRYRTTRLVYVEQTSEVDAALNREKEIKGWRRQKKLDLIRQVNPKFEDLFHPDE